jgi:hypothetical protein
MAEHGRKSYPKREAFYAVSLGRGLLNSGDVADIGDKAALLILYVALKEDQFHYRGWVNFWNKQLQELLGIKSRDKFIQIRKRAIEAGWLLYERENDRRPGYYMTQNPYDAPPSGDTNGGASRGASGDTNGGASGDTSIPLNPNTFKPNKPSKPTGSLSGFVGPTIKEVRQYAQKWSSTKEGKKLAASPLECVAMFHDHYQAQGWVTNNGKAIADWKASFRVWVRRERTDKPRRSEMRERLDL